MQVQGDKEAQEGTPRRGGGRQEKTFVKEGQAWGVETGRVVGARLQKGCDLSRPPFVGGGHVGDFYVISSSMLMHNFEVSFYVL